MKKRSAFTLIELVTTVALVGAVFAAGITALVSILRFYTTEQTRNRVSDDLTLAFAYLKRDGMRADHAVISVDGNGNPQLVLRITDYASAGHPSVMVTYSLSANSRILTRTHPTEGARQLTDLIDSAPALRPNPNYIYGPPTYPNNYLFAEIHTRDGASVAHQRMGIKLSEAPPA